MTDFHDPGQVTDAVLDAAQSFFQSAAAGTKVYDHKVPGDAGKMYVVAHVLDGGGSDGAFFSDQPDSDVTMVFQFDCVAIKRNAAQFLQGKLNEFVLGRTPGSGNFATPIEIPTAKRVAARVRDGAPGGVQVQGTSPQVLYVTQDRFALTITPSS